MAGKPLTLTVGESYLLRFDFARALEDIWQSAGEYSVGDFVRPSTPNGFEYECTNAGQTDLSEPAWPKTIAATVEDGSVQWTARDFALAATDTLSTGPVTGTGSGTIGTPTVEDTDVYAAYTATAKGLDVVTCLATTALGNILSGQFRITVKAAG